MTLPWLAADFAGFPPTHMAMEEPNGLLASGGDLSSETLLNAYAHGIFPWYNDGEPVLWWTPSPRCVLFPDKLHVSKSLSKHLRKCSWRVTLDTHFLEVMRACAEPRSDQLDSGTWISSDMQTAYLELYELGFAHCVAVWDQDKLVGGLYGVSLGRVFFGESMFSRASNASKTALAAFTQWLLSHGFELVDCQVENPHLMALGAQQLERDDFEPYLHRLVTEPLIKSYQSVWQGARGQIISTER